MDSWRITVLGDSGVGKTALTTSFILNCFVEVCIFLSGIPSLAYDSTIDEANRKMLIVDNQMCFVEVIDTESQEEYATLRDQWIREGQGFLLVYSIASRASFDHIDTLRQSIERVKRLKPIFVLVGNKADMQHERQVSHEEGSRLAAQFGCQFMETSAKTAHNAENAFTSLIRLLRRTRTTDHGPTGGEITSGPKKQPVKLRRAWKCAAM